MTPRQMRAIAALCDALAEAEQAGVPIVQESDPPTTYFEIAVGEASHRGDRRWQLSGLRLVRHGAGWDVAR